MIPDTATLIPPWPAFTAFLLASLVLAVTPGPGVLYIVSRSVGQGRPAGLVSVAGVALGNFGNAVAAALGVAAVFAALPWAFTALRYAGAVWLVVLAIRMLRSPVAGLPDGLPGPESVRRLFRDGFLVALLNPKTTLFFAAFLPQFLSAGAAPVAQSVLLGTLFVSIAAATDAAYAFAAGRVSSMLVRHRAARAAGHWLGGGTLLGLGIFCAFDTLRRAR